MNVLWIGMSALALSASLFIIWPLWRHRSSQVKATAKNPSTTEAGSELLSQRKQINVELYREHLSELTRSLDRGDIDGGQFDQMKLELDRSLLEDDEPTDGNVNTHLKTDLASRLYVLAFALLVPLTAVIYYNHFGFAGDLEIKQLLTEKHLYEMTAFRNKEPVDQSKARELIAKLESRLESQPDNMYNWYHLARTVMEVRDYVEAVKAYKQVLRLDPNAAQIMGELAQAMFLVAGNRVSPEAQMYVERTLAVDPNNRTALGLAGINAFGTGKYRAAIKYWQRALSHMEPGEPGAAALTDGISRARLQLGDSSVFESDAESEGNSPQMAATNPHANVKGTSGEKSKGKSQVTINVSLDAKAGGKANQVVFVYARAWRGPKMPLAIARLKVSDLPTQVVLDESMAMAPGMSLTSFPRLELVARLSLSGKPISQAGDWEATRGPVTLEELSDEVSLVIDKPVL